jgi:hypothetical protein
MPSEIPKKRIRTIGSFKNELIQKSREAVLSAIKIFNDPLISFKSETYIVLMIIAWTYLLHAYYRSIKIEYRYYSIVGNKMKFDTTKRGAYKYWELERCLNDSKCPIDINTKNNLLFIINLRHEIEHQMTLSLDNYLSGRYQACAINYNNYIGKLFGNKYKIDQSLTYSIQFIGISEDQVIHGTETGYIPDRLKAYIADFDSRLSPAEYNSENYSYRLLFTKKLVNRPGQADKIVEFVDSNTEIAKTIEKELWVKKEVEKPKFRATNVVSEVKKAGYLKFSITAHTNFWKNLDAKNQGKGYGIMIQGYWYWYQNWIDKCIELCSLECDHYK